MAQLELSTLILCKDVPFNNTYETTIDFASVTEQVNFFKTYRFNNLDINTTYLRTHRRIEVEYLRDDLFGVNYCMVYNYDKWYFYFITDKEYINENCTALTIEMDVFQTYMFDYTFGECFVDREHQDRFDLYGNATFNLEPENVEVGKTFKISKRYSVDPDVRFDSATGTFQDRSSLVWVYVWCTDPIPKPSDTSQYPDKAFNNSTAINDFPTNAWCYVFPTFLDFDDFKEKHQLSPAIEYYEIKAPNASGTHVLLDTNDPQYVKDFTARWKISDLASNAYVFNIAISAYPPVGVEATYSQVGSSLIIALNKTDDFYPIRLQEVTGPLTITASDCTCYYVQNQKVDKYSARIYDSESATPLVSVDLTKNKNYPVYAMSQYLTKNIDYEPKLNTSPYLLYTLKYGDKEIDLAPELMTDKNFYFFKSVTPTSDVLIYNKDYAGSDIGLTGQLVSPFACTVPQRTDPYKQYWATSRASYYTGMLVQGEKGIRGLVKGVINAASTGQVGNIFSAAVDSVGSTYDYVKTKQAMVQDLSNAPDTMTNTGDDVGVQLIYSPLSAYIMVKEILPQFKNKLFNFLYRYGYACNTYKTPNLKTRYWFNYIQMTDVVFKTNKVDSDYVDQLKSIFQKGTTIWHYHDIANYKTNYLYNYTNENLETSLI